MIRPTLKFRRLFHLSRSVSKVFKSLSMLSIILSGLCYASPSPVISAPKTPATAIKPMIFSGTAIKTASTHFPSPIPTPLIATPTITPTQTPILRAGAMPYARPSDLQNGMQTFRAEKRISFLVNGTEAGFERWRLVYRAPDECSLEVFDSKGNLERTKYYHGTTLYVDAGKIHQVLTKRSPQAWQKVVEFLDLKVDPRNVKDSRQLLQGLWIPNSMDIPLKSRKSGESRGIRHALSGVLVDTNVDSQLAKGGH